MPRTRIDAIEPEETNPVAEVVRDTYARIAEQIGTALGTKPEDRPLTPRELVRQGMRSLRAYVDEAQHVRQSLQGDERAERMAEIMPLLDEALARFEEALEVPSHYLEDLAHAYADRVNDITQPAASTKAGRRDILGSARIASRLYAKLGDARAIEHLAYAVDNRDMLGHGFRFRAGTLLKLAREVKTKEEKAA